MNARGCRAPALLAASLLLFAGCGGGARRERAIGPDFRIGARDLAQTTAGLRSDTRARIEADPAGFLRLMTQIMSAPQPLLTLVDKQHGLSPDEVPRDLVPLERTRLRAARKGLSLRAIVVPDMEAMAEAAERSGAGLLVSSAYRSYEYQQGLFERSVRAEGREQTERELALPGHSEHQLGTAVDFGSVDASFADTAAGRWLASEAWKYGFVLSYPRNGEGETGYIYEPWHFRYVGRPAAAMAHAFFGDDRQELLTFYREKEPYFRDRARTSGRTSP